MSLLVCLRGCDGLVLATDSRGTVGDPRGATAQNDRIKKLYLANEKVGILVAGAGDLGSSVVAGFLDLPGVSSLDVTELTMALHRYAKRQFRKWFDLFAIRPIGSDTRPARPDLNFIVAGLGSDQIPKIFRLSSSMDFAPMLHNYGFGMEGVTQYGHYLLSRLYDADNGVDELQELAAYVITETASQDGKVGGPVQVGIIAEDHAERLDMTAIDAIVLANQTRSWLLRESFKRKSSMPGRTNLENPLHSSHDHGFLPPQYSSAFDGAHTAVTHEEASALPAVADEHFATGVHW
ncbi:MAG: hypothetical protein ABI824_02370 [Acidobacteriota bacterium]